MTQTIFVAAYDAYECDNYMLTLDRAFANKAKAEAYAAAQEAKYKNEQGRETRGYEVHEIVLETDAS